MITKIRGGTLHTFDIEDLRIPQITNIWEKHMSFVLDDIIADDSPLVFSYGSFTIRSSSP